MAYRIYKRSTAPEYIKCKHVVWRDSVGVESSRSGLKSECADIFHQSFLCCYAILTSPREGETAVYDYNPALF